MSYSTETFDALVALTRTLRPRWDTPGVRKAIRDSLARELQPSLAELAYAVIRVAENFAVESPAVIPMDGPHWRNPIRDHVPPTAITCRTCGDLYMPHVEHVCTKRNRKGEHIAEIREAFHEARAVVCSHGVPPNLCKDHRDQPAEETP